MRTVVTISTINIHTVFLSEIMCMCVGHKYFPVDYRILIFSHACTFWWNEVLVVILFGSSVPYSKNSRNMLFLWELFCFNVSPEYCLAKLFNALSSPTQKEIQFTAKYTCYKSEIFLKKIPEIFHCYWCIISSPQNHYPQLHNKIPFTSYAHASVCA